MFRAFSDPLRLRILHLLLRGEMCVCDIVDITRVPQPTASRHLAYLRRAGLIVKRRDGLWSYYRLAPAESGFHKSLVKCLKECFRDVPELAADATRAAKARGCS
jgi:ArsR family transcriptional regulator, arsenate/arsenite/antimonite-responsive transcriptional repressor